VARLEDLLPVLVSEVESLVDALVLDDNSASHFLCSHTEMVHRLTLFKMSEGVALWLFKLLHHGRLSSHHLLLARRHHHVGQVAVLLYVIGVYVSHIHGFPFRRLHWLAPLFVILKLSWGQGGSMGVNLHLHFGHHDVLKGLHDAKPKLTSVEFALGVLILVVL